jgi:two-component system response regulator (stage 0 sporulation protein A)
MAIALELIMQEEQVTSTTRILYPMVAQRCNTKPARIERNVREEIKAIWNFGNQKRLDQLFINRGKYPPGTRNFFIRSRGISSRAAERIS